MKRYQRSAKRRVGWSEGRSFSSLSRSMPRSGVMWCIIKTGSHHIAGENGTVLGSKPEIPGQTTVNSSLSSACRALETRSNAVVCSEMCSRRIWMKSLRFLNNSSMTCRERIKDVPPAAKGSGTSAVAGAGGFPKKCIASGSCWLSQSSRFGLLMYVSSPAKTYQLRSGRYSHADAIVSRILYLCSISMSLLSSSGSGFFKLVRGMLLRAKST